MNVQSTVSLPLKLLIKGTRTLFL